MAKARYAKVHTAIAIGQPVVLRRIIEGNRVLQVRAGQGGIAQIKPTDPDHKMRYQKKRLILDVLRKLEALLAQLHRRLMFRAGYIKEPQAMQDREMFWRLSDLLTQLTGTRVGLDHFRGSVALSRQQ
jgi:hypothetical protein